MIINKRDIKLKNNVMNLFELIIFWYLILQVLFINWFIPKNLTIYISLIIVVYLFCIRYKYNIVVNKKHLIIIYIVFTMILFNLLIHGVRKYTFTSIIKYSFVNVSIVIFFVYIVNEKRQYIEEHLLKYLCIFLNLYFIFNLPIIFKQMSGTYFLMRNYTNNPMYKDHITGLIGSSGTHILTLFWISLVIINLYYCKKNSVLLILTVIELIFMIFISTKNDNTVFIFLLPLIIFQLYLYNILKFNIKRIIQVILICITSTITINCLINTNEDVKKFYNDRVLVKYEQIMKKQENRSSTQMKDEERIALLKYSLAQGNGYKTGMGIGSVTYGDKSMPAHFGMSEISIKVYEGGIIYFSVLILLYGYYYYKIISNGFTKKTSKRITFYLVILNCLLLAMYTQIFRIVELTILLSLICMLLNMNLKKEGL